ncbi:MAG: nucleotidyltransferase domain-containing protein [Thermoproteota archaeon]
MVRRLRENIGALSKQLSLSKVILFGSYAKKKYTVSSDIDVLVVFDEQRTVEDVYKMLRRNIDLPKVELHVLSEKDYGEMKNSKWIKTIEEEGIKIF